MTLFDEKEEIPPDSNSLYTIIDRRDDYLSKLKGKIKDLDKWMESPRIKLDCKSPNYLIWHNNTKLLDKLIESGELDG